jgi:hypothetical protein
VARQSLRPHLNQIRTWVRQGRTDAWIAHQLDVTVNDIEVFKRDHALTNGEALAGGDYDDEIDLRAEDDALIAAQLEAERAETSEDEQAEPELEEELAGEAADGDEDEDGDEELGEDSSRGEAARRRRRGRRGGRRRSGSGPLEGTFDHGEEGYGLWLDPAVADNPVYAEHWAGHRAVRVIVEAEQIVIRRA